MTIDEEIEQTRKNEERLEISTFSGNEKEKRLEWVRKRREMLERKKAGMI